MCFKSQSRRDAKGEYALNIPLVCNVPNQPTNNEGHSDGENPVTDSASQSTIRA